MAIQQVYNACNEHILTMDASFIPKAGKCTYGLGKFWNGAQSRSMRGLEISNVALVDVGDKSAYSLIAKQVPVYQEDSSGSSDENSIDFFLSQLREVKKNQQGLATTIKLPKHIAFDGFYTKKRFVDGVVGLGFDVIGKLRRDANLRHLYKGKVSEGQKRGRGRPRKFDGKLRLATPDEMEFVEKVDEEISLYSAVLCSVGLARVIRVVYILHRAKSGKLSYALLFSTDLSLSAHDIYQYYGARFQIEFIFRDAKQFSGLTHCQGRCRETLDFHFNMSLALVNLMRIEHRLDNKEADNKSFSMASHKRQYANENILRLFLSKLEIDPDCEKIQSVYQELRNYGTIAA
jgi:Transposase DDE domain.